MPRAAISGYLGPGDGCGPLPKAALNALHNGVFDPAISIAIAVVVVAFVDMLASGIEHVSDRIRGSQVYRVSRKRNDPMDTVLQNTGSVSDD